MSWLYRLNIQQRILLYFTIVILLTILIASYLIYKEAAAQIKNQTEVYLHHIVENTSYQTDRYIMDLELATLSLLSDQRIKGFLDLGDDQLYERYQYNAEIKRLMNRISIQHNDINLIYLVGEQGQMVLSEDRVIKRAEYGTNLEIYGLLKETTPESGQISLLGKKSIYNQSPYVISITRRVRGTASFVPKGILGVDINAVALEKLWNIGQLRNDTSLWIIDTNGKIVYHSDPNLIGITLKDDILQQFTEEEEGAFIDNWASQKTMFYYSRSAYTGWTLVATTPEINILEPVSGVKRNAFVASFIAMFVALLISTGFTRSVVRPLRKVEQGMKMMESGEWEKIKPLKGSDEISRLVISYNKMIERLTELVEDLYTSELRNQKVLIDKQRSELQALQSQINPHFLHNTLETMNAYAILNEAEEISEMATALSSMFRYSVRNFEVVTLREEMDHVKNFLIVQEHRFQKKIQVNFHIPQSLFGEEVVKLSLQPIVENAIHHGLRKRCYKGEIDIYAKVDKHKFVISVCDNGVGITNERMEEINEQLATEQLHEWNRNMGIGVSNVHRRIRLICGEGYGLTICGSEEEGTAVTLTFRRSTWKESSA